MIIINLLPPEMRRRKAEFALNPMVGGAIGGAIACLLMLGAFLWVKGRVANATAILEDRTAVLAEKTILAQAVLDKKASIAAFENRRDAIFALLGRKMYWARTIDEFSKQIAGEWSIPGFKVSAQSLTISDLPTEKRAGGAEEVRASFRWQYKIVGDVLTKSGEYNKSFYSTVQNGPFWNTQGFIGKTDERYLGDRPIWDDNIKKVIIVGAVDWQRFKLAEFMKKGAKTPVGN